MSLRVLVCMCLTASAVEAVAAPVPNPMPRSPEPPQQHAAWTPPATTLPPAVTTAAIRLFADGVADPRGGTYREIELDVGNVWTADPTPVMTHGWVLPGPAGYAVAWNGLVYRTRKVGGAADVGADIDALLAANAAEQARQRRDDPDETPRHYRAGDEAGAVKTASVEPIKTILLLRLGDGARAARLWTASGVDATDPYRALAEDWLWSRFDRGVTAHQRGDVALAIESWGPLPALARAVGAPTSVTFLADIAALLADERRRAAAAPAPSLAAIDQLPPPARIAALITSLDQVSVRQDSQPGGVILSEDPIVAALVAQGEPAIAPLLAAFEVDERLTRSVRFHRDFMRHRVLIPAYEAEFVALISILDASSVMSTVDNDQRMASGRDGRRAVAAELRAYAAKYRGASPIERAYRILADDHATDQWVAAAEQITRGNGVWMSSTSTPRASVGLPPNGLAGESLRAGHRPTVTALLIARLHATAAWRPACVIATALLAWDPPAAIGPTSALFDDLVARMRRAQGDARAEYPYVGQCLAALTTQRLAAGDRAALAAYRAWLVTTTPADAQFATDAWFAPMAANPRAPEMTAAAATLFGPRSPWVPFTSSYVVDLLRLGDLDASGSLLPLPAFRAHVSGVLADHTVVGELRIISDQVAYKTTDFSTGDTFDRKDPRGLPEGTIAPLRRCDLYAITLARAHGAPPYHLYLPVADRDRELVALQAWVQART